ncbi:unnamed protein product [Amoebophrya sp. A120]|nr:unnamed protein product [Amoebophrya sp. A120]CAD7975892.1 unnamed protein product [Amoebophrya sp. A120]|eukprot:GSA120T00026255001.1
MATARSTARKQNRRLSTRKTKKVSQEMKQKDDGDFPFDNPDVMNHIMQQIEASDGRIDFDELTAGGFSDTTEPSELALRLTGDEDGAHEDLVAWFDDGDNGENANDSKWQVTQQEFEEKFPHGITKEAIHEMQKDQYMDKVAEQFPPGAFDPDHDPPIDPAKMNPLQQAALQDICIAKVSLSYMK